ncbi:hypothetical protein C8F04DRAFT_1263492 [Mycena alexandri]|uniref:Glucose-methanol-choline oxidoreductase C-terminal domain-containing protein n=1 Tax=Mycena alexandri TaxID=1745969 RepID=A0AAD6SQU5_9AGAR|nr:hypothetical protein C8F04DRAFT_1263492 [Mycena alexandri]
MRVNYFNVSSDFDVQVAGLKISHRLFNTPLLNFLSVICVSQRSLDWGSGPRVKPAVPDDAEGGPDADWKAWSPLNFASVAHCSELGLVVDAHLEVYNTQNVRVVDVSIIPFQLSAHLLIILMGNPVSRETLIQTLGVIGKPGFPRNPFSLRTAGFFPSWETVQ